MSMRRIFVIGDIHGAYEALRQCLGRAEFDPGTDRLICLGDVCDRRPEVKRCVDELLRIKDLVFILGNHDRWTLEWMAHPKKGISLQQAWLDQGGADTVASYSEGIPSSHLELFQSAKLYHLEGNRLFVHGGIDPLVPLDQQDADEFLWNRTLVLSALAEKDQQTRFTQFEEIFVGHTPTINIPRLAVRSAKISHNHPGGLLRHAPDIPLRLCNIWMMDTGAGWPGGRLSMMNIDTGEIFQSDRLD